MKNFLKLKSGVKIVPAIILFLGLCTEGIQPASFTWTCTGACGPVPTQTLGTVDSTNITKNLMNAMAVGAVAPSRGMGTNYTSNNSLFGPKIAIVGLNIGVGLNAPGQSAFGLLGNPTSLDTSIGQGNIGLAAQVGIMAGFNFKALPFLPAIIQRFKVFANFGGFNLPLGTYGFNMSNFGLHVQFSLIEPKSLIGIISWGGIDLTTGIDSGSNVFSATVPMGFSISGGNTWSPTSTMSLTNTYFSIPIEASTSIQLALLSVFGGVGLDINSGKSTLDITATGPINGGSATGTAVIKDEVLKGSFGVRLFLGTQIAIFPIKIQVQMSNDFATGNFTIGLGTRVAI